MCTLRPSETRLSGTVYVDFVVTNFPGRFHKILHDWRLRPEVLHGQVTAPAVVLRFKQFRYAYVLGFYEVRQHVPVAPALVSGLVPRVIVPSVAPDVEHGV